MAESKEYAIITKCSWKLEIALKSDRDIVLFLLQQGFITQEHYDEVSNPKSNLTEAEKVSMLVTAIRNRVELNPRNYYKMVDHLRQNRIRYGDIVEILDQEYHGSTSPGVPVSGPGHAVKDPPLPPLPTSSKVTSSPLGMIDYFEVTRLLEDMTINDIIQLGTALGLSYHKLEKMEFIPDNVVAAWLRQDDLVLKNSGPPSWTSLATALKEIGHLSIAAKIRKEKLHAVKDLPFSPPSSEKSPGIVFHQKTIIQDVTPKGIVIEGMGIRLSIPDNSVEESLTLLIFPCLRGPFHLPEDYVSASPAYLIKCNRKVNFQKDVTLRIHHYAHLESTSDCDDMVFLSASSTPEKWKDGPVYTFKEIEEAKGIFEPDDHVGEIMLRHFCIVKLGRKRRRASHSPATKKSKEDEIYYSARFYRNLSNKLAVFCVCLLQEVYTSHCDSIIMKGMQGWGLPSFVPAQLTSNEVAISVTEGSAGWNVVFDKEPTTILKNVIHLPETLHKKVSKCPDYPPRLSMTLCKVEDQETQHSNCFKFEVKGLDRECYFNIVIPVEVQVPPSSSGVSSMADPHSALASSSSTDTSQVQQGLDQAALCKSPTMMDLLWCGERNLAEEIGSKYFGCGVFLLEDKTGARMRAIERELNRNACDINYRIFEEWLSGSGKKPVTWGTLITVLQEIKMTQLAETIASNIM